MPPCAVPAQAGALDLQGGDGQAWAFTWEFICSLSPFKSTTLLPLPVKTVSHSIQNSLFIFSWAHFFSEINMARYYQTERDGGKKTELLYQLYNQNLVARHNSHCQIISHSVVWSVTLKLAALEKSVTFLFGLAGFSICRIWVSE